MVVAMFPKLAFTGLAAAIAAGAGLVTSAGVEAVPAYGAAATKLDVDAAARHAASVYQRADLDNDGALDSDEFEVLAIVTAELARLNGFVAVDVSGGARTVAVATGGKPSLSATEKARLSARADREFDFIAGDDLKLAPDEFVAATLEAFMANDVDRNGALTGAELAAFAAAKAGIPARSS